MKQFGIAGWSGSGKTSLIVALIPELVRRGVTVSTVKHAHHNFDIDQPGKDSFRHRAAGATEVMVASDQRWAIMHELRGGAEPTLEELIARMTPVDLVLIEGYKSAGYDKIEIHRPSVGKPFLHPEDPHVIAVASDETLPGLRLPVFSLADTGAIAEFILARCGLSRARVGAA